MMFSRTVKFCTSLKCWNTIPIPARMALWLSGIAVTWPLMTMSPASAR
jgi:hypothetical protein